MCLILTLPKLSVYKKQWIDNAWETNPHGAGFAYTNGKNVCTLKGFFNKDEFIKSLDEHRLKYPESSFIVHLRWASKGKINIDNCHPFISGDVAFCHNGTIRNIPTSGDRSDTSAMGKFMSGLPSGFYNNVGYKALIENFIGGSKMAFIDAVGEIVIFNESLGVYEGDIWLSNEYYKGGYTRDKDGVALKTEPSHECRVCKVKLLDYYEREVGSCYDCMTDVAWGNKNNTKGAKNDICL